jgi:hypothetical protein
MNLGHYLISTDNDNHETAGYNFAQRGKAACTSFGSADLIVGRIAVGLQNAVTARTVQRG